MKSIKKLFSKQFYSYTSEATTFIDDLKKSHPDLEQEQVHGRSLLWDRPSIDLDSQHRTAESRVEQQPYVYQNRH